MKRMIAAVVVIGTASCAARFQGELDGKPVPPFSSVAYNAETLETSGRKIVSIMAVRGDSCAAATQFTTLSKLSRSIEATAEARLQARRDLATLLNTEVPPDEWRLQATLSGDNELSLRGNEVDLQSLDTDVAVRFTLCRSEGIAEVNGGALFLDETCYTARAGRLAIDLNDGEQKLRLTAEQTPLTFQDGELLLDMTANACAGFDADMFFVQDISGGGGGGGGGGAEPQPEPFPGDCFEECFEDRNGDKVCQVNCLP